MIPHLVLPPQSFSGLGDIKFPAVKPLQKDGLRKSPLLRRLVVTHTAKKFWFVSLWERGGVEYGGFCHPFPSLRGFTYWSSV